MFQLLQIKSIIFDFRLHIIWIHITVIIKSELHTRRDEANTTSLVS